MATSTIKTLLDVWRTGTGSARSTAERRAFYRVVQRLHLQPALAYRQRRWLSQEARSHGLSWDRLLESRPGRIFVISFHKTGTRSVHQYLEMCGLRGMHLPLFKNCGVDYEYLLRRHVGDEEACLACLAPLFADFDFYADVPFPGLYRAIASKSASSRAILVRRPVDEWWGSVVRHLSLDQHSHRLSSFEAIQYGLPYATRVSLADENMLCDKYLSHLTAVETCFRNGKRLLTIDLADPAKGEALSRFVGCPDVHAFPRIRRGGVQA